MLEEIGVQDSRSGLASGEEHNKLLAKVHRYLQDMRGMLGVKLFFWREEGGAIEQREMMSAGWVQHK